MGQITVCDFPGCGSAVDGYGDKLRLNFDLAEIFAEREPGALREMPPQDFRRDLCREHGLKIRSLLEGVFSGELVT